MHTNLVSTALDLNAVAGPDRDGLRSAAIQRFEAVCVPLKEEAGKTELNRPLKPTLSNHRDNYPLREFDVDHALLDILIVDEGTGLLVGRPRVTVALDRHTKMIVGFHIGFESPDRRAVAACLPDIIRPEELARDCNPAMKRAARIRCSVTPRPARRTRVQ